MDLIQRARAIVLTPAAEWRTIERESGDAGYLFANYVAALAAVPPVCMFLRRHVFGYHPHFHAFGGFFSGLFAAFLHWLVALALVYVMAIVVDRLAPTFAARENRENATKLVVYSMTPVWLAGVLALIPGLGFLRLLALLYGIYVFWLGLPVLMQPAPDRAGQYTLAVVLCGIVLWAVAAAAIGPSV